MTYCLAMRLKEGLVFGGGAVESGERITVPGTKYGKFLLEMAATLDVDAETVTKIALGSMMSTARANLSVGPPYDLGLYTRDRFEVDEFRIEADSPVLLALQETWERQLRASFAGLPSFTREDLLRSP